MSTRGTDRQLASARSKAVIWLVLAILCIVTIVLNLSGTDRAFQAPFTIFAVLGLVVSVFALVHVLLKRQHDRS